MAISRRGLITGLVSLLAAPAIVRVGSLMPVRALIEPLIDPMATEWDGAYREITLGYSITRKAVDNALFMHLARLKREGQPYYEDPFDDPDTAALWGGSDVAGWTS